MRILVVPFLIAIGLLVVALLLPSRRDTSVAAWRTRVVWQGQLLARVMLGLALAGGIVWYVLLPLLGWRSLGL